MDQKRKPAIIARILLLALIITLSLSLITGGIQISVLTDAPLNILVLLLALWYTFGKFFGYTNAESGFTSIMIIVIFFGGVQLLMIGVLGQYIGILFDEVKGRPEYIIKDTLNLG